jgi:hypothetical protein
MSAVMVSLAISDVILVRLCSHRVSFFSLASIPYLAVHKFYPTGQLVTQTKDEPTTQTKEYLHSGQ